MMDRMRKWYRGLPDKKRYFEFLSALLTIPVLLTVILLNWGALSNKSKEQPTPTPAQEKIITVVPVEKDKEASSVPTTASCKKEVGPVAITSPKESETVSQEPVCFTIEYKDLSYCSVVWTYRIDNGSWSDFNDKSVCLYNLSNGDHKFELRVKSVVSSDETQLVRNFTYQGKLTPTPTP